MKAIFRIERALAECIQVDLTRPHPFAKERVGFIACGVAAIETGYLLLAHTYRPVDDADYENDARVGAMMGSGAIRQALQYAYNNRVAMFHVHRHEHRGTPEFSPLDVQENAKFVPDFWKVRSKLPHGAIVMSLDSMTGAWWNPHTKQAQNIDEMAVLGRPIVTHRKDS
jgi:hypothetical protein